MQCTSTRTCCALFAAVVAVAWTTSREAHADDDDALREPEAQIGLGVRLRRVHIPDAALDLFFERSGGGATHTGVGGEIIRQKGSFIMALGVEYEEIAAQDGIYLDKGKTLPQDVPDYVAFEDFRWVGVDATFMWQQRLIGDTLSLRYGAGLGLGYIMGEVKRTDYVCTTADESSCGRDPNAVYDDTPEDGIPPVFPIVNVVVGAQIRPIHNLAINIEGGIRTLPFFGTTVALMF